MSDSFNDTLRRDIDNQWAQIKKGLFWKTVTSETCSPELYRDLMIEIYHYTRHNSKNQAAAAFVEAPEGLLKFVYRHAAEELGHERMVAHDLRSVGLIPDETILNRQPLPPTEAMIGYLYYVALRYGPIARLGYSFWAESVYSHIGPLLVKISADLSLGPKNITFFGSHIQADKDHAEQVEDAVESFAVTAEDRAAVRQVANTTLFLTGQLMDAVALKHTQRAAALEPA